ncbi:hypothetical protein JCM11641_004857 [Rhodosporidiobolus odoratus]
MGAHSPAPTTRDGSPRLPATQLLHPDFHQYLLDSPLAVAVFSHADLDKDAFPEPILKNDTLIGLLDQGDRVKNRVEGDGGHTASFSAGLASGACEELRVWLKEGLSAFSSSNSSTSSSPASTPSHSTASANLAHHVSLSREERSADVPSPRHLALKFRDNISWPHVHFSVTVRATYTVLTQLPRSAVSKGFESDTAASSRKASISSIPSSHSPSSDPPSPSISSLSRLPSSPATSTSFVERMGELELGVNRVRDPLTPEGIAWTAWNSAIAIFRVDRTSSITQVNPTWRKLTGVPPHASNDSWPSRIHPDDLDRVLAHYDRFKEDLPDETDEVEFRWKPGQDGGEQWCTVVRKPLRLQGRIEGYSCYMANINKHKALETAASARERQLRDELVLLFDSCPVGLSRHAIDGRFLRVNKAWLAITQLKEGDDLEKWEENVHPEDHDRVVGAWRNAVKLRESLVIQFRWANGHAVLVQVKPNNSNSDELTGWIGITAQRRAEEAVLQVAKEREGQAKREAEMAEESRKAAVEEKKQQELLIDVTSHEIRNPISAILQNSDFTRSSLRDLRALLIDLKSRKKLPAELDGKVLDDLEEDIEALDSITECGQAQERIANDILGLAQIQLSKYSITPVEFDLATSLRNICRMFKSECRSKNIELKLVIGSSLARLGPRARVFADPARLTQVLVNLLSNAIRFTAKSATRQVTLSVEISSKPPERDAPLVPHDETEYHIEKKRPIYLFFSVEDTGPGMTEEETGKLFAKFSQGSPFTHTAWGGSGLGLWIARNLCELQLGRIEVASTVGKGSIFRCFITARSVDAGPSKKSEVDSLPVVEGITGPNAHRGETPRVYLASIDIQAPLSGLKVLCCEDNQINRTVLKRQLTKEGCSEILLACDGQEGLNVLNGLEPGDVDCILMDIEMPVMDGLAATRAIRLAEQQGQRRGHQRIVGLTGNARQGQKQAALDAGMDTVVTKPYKVQDLIERICSGPDSSTAPPSPNLSPSTAPTDSRDKRNITYAIGSTSDRDEGVRLLNETSVLNITGDDQPKARGTMRAIETSVERLGVGYTFPPSQDNAMEVAEKE